MKRFSLVIAVLTTLSASVLGAQRTPTPTPMPHDGPVLDVTFSGVVLFLKTPSGYRVMSDAAIQNHPLMIS